MKGNGKRVLSLCLAAVIAVTTVWYAPPPFTASASWKTNMEKALEFLASPSEASKQESTTTPSEAESPGREATPSEAEIPDGKATPSQAVKKFVRVEPEEIPDYYSQVSASGKKFWKFEDRNGMVQYRDYGYVQGDAEFPLWYVTDLTGAVDDTYEFVNLDEEYYSEAPYIYRSVAPDQTAWTNLSWKILNDSESIFLFNHKEIKPFINWDQSSYSIWSVNGLREQPEESSNELEENELEDQDLGHFFYGQISNERDSVNKWYYADADGRIIENKNFLLTSLAAVGSIGWYHDAPGDYRAPRAETREYSGETTLGMHSDVRTISEFQKQNELDFYSNNVAWASFRTQPPILYNGYNNINGDPAKASVYLSGGTLYGLNYKVNASNSYNGQEFYSVWCPRNADMYIFFAEERVPSKVPWFGFGTSDQSFDLSCIIVRRNESFDISIAQKPSKQGYQFKGWKVSDEDTVINDGTRLNCGSSAKVTLVFPVFTPNTNIVTFLDAEGNILKEETVLSGYTATAPTPPVIAGKTFTGWGGDYTNITKDSVFKAQYKDTVTLTLMGNGGLIGGSETYIKELTYNADIYDLLKDLKANTAKPLCTFKGWYTNPEGTGSDSHFKITSDLTLYAVWNRIYNSIKYFHNYDSSDTTTSYSEIKYAGDPIGALKVLPPSKGYRLKGWSTYKPGYNTYVTPETIMTTEQLVLYGQWETWMVNCNIDYGVGDSRLPSTRSISSIVTNKNLLENYLPSTASMEVPGYISTGYSDGWRDENGAITLSDYNYPSGSDRNIYFARTPKTLKFTSWFPSNTTSSWESTTSNFVNGKYGEIISSDNYDNLIKIKNEKIYDDGRVFKGFYYDKALTKPIDFSLGLKPEDPVQSVKTIDVNVYSKYVKVFALTFKDWDGSILSNQTVPYGESAELPEPPVRTGYRFIGWDKSYDNIQADTVLTAQYEINSHSLTLDGNGGSLSGKTNITMDVTTGESLDQDLTDGKNNAVRKYYTFTGWYTAPTEGSKYPESGNVMPDTDLTVYAQWERSSSEVTFKDWNGNVIDRQEILIGADATLPEAPERAGYTFVGWDKPKTNIQDHTEITAQYSINGYLLTLDGNGGTLERSPKKEVVISFDQSFDQILVDGKNQVNRPGYHFDGWYTNASGGSSYSYSGNKMPSINMTVFAHWSVNTYKVAFDPDHERWTGGVIKEERDFDTALGTLPTPEIYGWKLTGWWTGKNESGTRATAQSMVEAKDVIYYGNWEPVTYPVHFVSKVAQPEGESVQTFTVSQTYDQAFKNLPEPEEKGYTFTGWYDESDKKLNPQSIFQPESGAEAYTYHAGWIAHSYKVKFVYYDADGKQVVIEINQDYPSRFGTLPVPEKPGYTFTGWFNDSGEEATAGSWVEAGDAEYKARWKANQYTIHFERNLPESETIEDPEDKTVTHTLPIGVLPYLNETGYVFLGWFTEQEGGRRIRETTLAALGDQTYYGHWAIGIINNGNGTYRRPGADGKWNTADDALWWNGLDGISQTSDDRRILTFLNGTGSYVDNGNGTHYRPGELGNWTSGIESWWNGADVLPGTSDDRQIHILPGESGYYIDNGDGTFTKPGTGGSWTSGTEHWWYGPDGKPGTSDDRQIYILPGGSYYINNGDGTYIKPGTGGSWTSGTEHWWYGPNGKPGTTDDRQIHVLPGGSYYIDNGDGTYIKPGTGGSWTNGTEHWWYGPDGSTGTRDDKLIHVIPGGGSYVDNSNGTNTRPGDGGSWKPEDTEHWSNGTDGSSGTSDDKLIHVIPGGGSYVDNGDGTNTRPGDGGSWKPGDTEHWKNGPDGVPGTLDDYKKDGNGNTDPEPTKPEPTEPEPTKPEPSKPDPVKPEPTNPSMPEPSNEPNTGKEDGGTVTVPEIPLIDSTIKPRVRNDGGTFKVNPENPKDVTYIKSDGTPANNEWVGDGTNLYHVNEESKLNYSWFKEKDKMWFMLNNESGEQFGAALRGWYSEPMDKKKYFLDPTTTEMLTGWQRIDGKSYYFTEKNQRKTYTGDNKIGWLFDFEILNTPLSNLDRPYGSMYRNEYTPDGYWVDENGVCADKK